MTLYQKDAPGSQLSFGKIEIDLAVMVCELWPFKGDAKWQKKRQSAISKRSSSANNGPSVACELPAHARGCQLSFGIRIMEIAAIVFELQPFSVIVIWLTL